MTHDLVQMLKSLAASYGPLLSLLMDVSTLAGVFSVIWGLHALRPESSYLRSGGTSKGCATAILVGGVLVSIPTFLDAMTRTFFATGVQNYVFAYDGSNTSTSADSLGPIWGLLQLYGTFVFVKGWWQIRSINVHGARGGATTKGAIVRICFGMALVNIQLTISVISKSLGVNLSNIFN